MSGIDREKLKQHVRHFAVFAFPAAFICFGIIRGGTLSAGLTWGLNSLPLLLIAALVVFGKRKNQGNADPGIVEMEPPQRYARFGRHQLADPLVPFLIPAILTLFLFVAALFSTFFLMFGAAAALLILSIACGWTAASLIRQDANPQWHSWTPKPRGALLCAIAIVPCAIYAQWNLRTVESKDGLIVGRTIFHSTERSGEPTVSYFVEIQSVDLRNHSLKSAFLFDTVEKRGGLLPLDVHYARLTNEFVAVRYEGTTIQADSGARFEARGLIFVIIGLLGWSVLALFRPKGD